MTNRTNWSIALRLCSMAAVTSFATDALAFKSDKAAAVLSPAAPPAPFPFPGYGFGSTGLHHGDGEDIEFNYTLPAPFTVNGGLRYVFAVRREAQLGAASPDEGRSFLQGLYLCPISARD